jgi:predicted acylesterase/phospholipase RssA
VAEGGIGREAKMDGSKRPRVGLVLEGGGAKGAYAFGCLKAFKEKGVRFDAVAGTSVGALNAILWSGDRLDAGERLWRDLSQKNIFPHRWPKLLRLLLAPAIIAAHVYATFVRRRELTVRIRVFVAIVVGGPWPLLTAIAFNNSNSHADSTIQLGRGLMVGTMMGLLTVAAGIGRVTRLPSGLLWCGWFYGIGGLLDLLDHIGGDHPKGDMYSGLVSICIFLIYAVIHCLLLGIARLSVLVSAPLREQLDQLFPDKFTAPTYVTVAYEQILFFPEAEYEREAFIHEAEADPPIHPCIQTAMVPVYVPIHDDAIPIATRRAAALASASLPFGVVPSIMLRKKDLSSCSKSHTIASTLCENLECVDGGVADNTPILPLLIGDAKCDTVIVVALRRATDYEQELRAHLAANVDRVQRSILEVPWSLLTESKRRCGCRYSIRRMTVNLTPKVERIVGEHMCADCERNAALNLLAANTISISDFTLKVIMPAEHLGGTLRGTMNFSAGYTRRLMQMGYEDGLRAVDSLRSFLNFDVVEVPAPPRT